MSTIVHEYFIEAPEESYKETQESIDKVKNVFRNRAESFESNLEHSNISGGNVNVDNFKFGTTEENDVEDLIAKSLMLQYNSNWADLKQDLKHKTLKNYNKDLDSVENASSRKIEIIKRVYEFLGHKEQEIENWISSSRAGLYCPHSSSSFGEQNGIVLEIIPESFAKEIEGSHHHILNPIIEQSVRHEQNFNEVLLHELNHAYLDLNSDIHEGHNFITSGPGSNNFENAFNEIFAYYTSYVVSGYQFKDKKSELYGRSDIIKWGVEVLIEKSSEFESRGKKSTGIDFSRELMIKISGHNKPIGVFLNFCLLKQDKRRIEEFEKILKKLETSYNEFKETLKPIWELDLEEETNREEDYRNDNMSKKQELLSDMMFVMNFGPSSSNKVSKGKLPYPHSFKKEMIETIIEDTIENENPKYPDLKQINQIITSKLYNIAEELVEPKKELEKAITKFDNPNIAQEISEMEEKVFESRKTMEEIIQKGKL